MVNRICYFQFKNSNGTIQAQPFPVGTYSIVVKIGDSACTGIATTATFYDNGVSLGTATSSGTGTLKGYCSKSWNATEGNHTIKITETGETTLSKTVCVGTIETCASTTTPSSINIYLILAIVAIIAILIYMIW